MECSQKSSQHDAQQIQVNDLNIIKDIPSLRKKFDFNFLRKLVELLRPYIPKFIRYKIGEKND